MSRHNHTLASNYIIFFFICKVREFIYRPSYSCILSYGRCKDIDQDNFPPILNRFDKYQVPERSNKITGQSMELKNSYIIMKHLTAVFLINLVFLIQGKTLSYYRLYSLFP